MQIGIIAEGESDQIAIEAIIQSHLNNKDISADPLQPKKGAPGGWPLVVSYCKSKDFQESLPFNEGLTIIHIDCDVLKGENIPEDCVMQFNQISTNNAFEMVREKLIEFITPAIFDQVAHKIVFAIAIDSIECWFLPIYYPTKPAKQDKTTGCISTLNQELTKQEGFYIDEKDEGKYRTISKHFFEKGMIKRCYEKNKSFSLFIDSLDSAFALYQAENT